MANIKCILGTVVLFLFYTWTDAMALRNSTDEQQELKTSESLELNRKDLVGDHSNTMTASNCMYFFTCADVTGDKDAFRRVRRNADPCVHTHCKWPRSSNGNVYVPVQFDDSLTLEQKWFVYNVMQTFKQSTCVRFILRKNQNDYIHIKPADSCSSRVGRQGGVQILKLDPEFCFTVNAVQHELLHALGFHHEQSRSDRDQHIDVNWDNINYKNWHNFVKRNTDNLRTPYDYNSVMHYEQLAGSNNGEPSLVAKPVSDVEFGTATEMSQTDIDRVNRLYCTRPSRTIRFGNNRFGSIL
ncbi:hypothetical protein WMY93_013139 [Mugilogobius chulae]|uniref:Metalloendopeptidase n=1 Tax=Mugilogobius chulae TaxID=88201 RepID=A0AAW0NZ62_9GOBI